MKHILLSLVILLLPAFAQANTNQMYDVRTKSTKEIVIATLLLEASNNETDIIAHFNVFCKRANFKESNLRATILTFRKFTAWNYVFYGHSVKGSPFRSEAYMNKMFASKKGTFCKLLVESAFNGGVIKDESYGADHYYDDSISEPQWASNMQVTRKIGRTVYLNSKQPRNYQVAYNN